MARMDEDTLCSALEIRQVLLWTVHNTAVETTHSVSLSAMQTVRVAPGHGFRIH
jgi:hypothetical protein